MNWSHAVYVTTAVACLAGCAGYENVDAKADAEAAPVAIPDVASQADPEQYRISVEIPVDDVTIERGENLDVDALLDERTSFTASDFHLREVVLIARSRRGGSAELLVGEWASGAVDIPEGTVESWYEVRIPAADVGEAGVEWVVDFTGTLDLNLLVAVLEPRSALLAAATATVREVAVEDNTPVVQPEEPLAEPSVEVVQSVEVVEPVTATPTVVREVAVVEQPVYRTQTVYRYVDRPVFSYRVSWIYDQARYYVFRNHGGWTYRYFPGTWDWRCFNPSFRLPIRHYHHDRNRHRADRHDGRRYERRDRDDHRHGDRDLRRSDRARDVRGRHAGDDRDRRGVRPRGDEIRAVVSRPRALRRMVDPGHPRIQLAIERRAPAGVEENRRTSPQLRTLRGTGQLPNNVRDAVSSRAERPEGGTNPRSRAFQQRDSGVAGSPVRIVASPPRVGEANARRAATNDRSGSDRSARPRSFERRETRQVEPRTTAADAARRQITRPTVASRIETSEPPRDGHNARTRAFQRRPEQRAPARTGSTRTTTASSRTTPAQRTFQREADPRRAATATRSTQPRTHEPRRTVTSTTYRQRSVERDDGNARTRAFQRRPVVEPDRQRSQPGAQSRPRSTPPVRSIPPRETRPTSRPQRTAPARNPSQRERIAQRAPVPTKNDAGSGSRSDQGGRPNARTAFERR